MKNNIVTQPRAGWTSAAATVRIPPKAVVNPAIKAGFIRAASVAVLAALATLFLSVISASAATFYVDSSATGANNGTNWANAWVSPTNITGATSGDTVYISGGPSGSSQTYALPIHWNVVAGVTYQIGQDGSHNGTAIFDGSGDAVTYSTGSTNLTWFQTMQNNVTFSGRVTGDTNIHFIVRGYGCLFRLEDVSGVTVDSLASSNLFEFNRAGGFGFTGTLKNLRINCNDLSALGDHAVSIMHFNNSFLLDSYFNVVGGSNVTTHTRNIGYDAIQMNGHDSMISNVVCEAYVDTNCVSVQHPDGFQTTADDPAGCSNFVIAACQFLNFGNYGVFINPNFGDARQIKVVNSVFNLPGANVVVDGPGGVVVLSQNGGRGTTNMTVADITVANNLFLGYCPTVSQNAIGFSRTVDGSGWTNTWSTLRADNNIIVGSTDSIHIGSANLTVGALTTNSNISITGATATNSFASYTTNSLVGNYRLTSGATSLIGAGTNLSSFFTTDADGVTRTNWDIGPYAYKSATLKNLRIHKL